MSANGVQLAGLWGYAEADPVLVAILVAAVLAFAIVYLVLRASGRRDPNASERKRADKRG
jgi:hypothetical protein